MARSGIAREPLGDGEEEELAGRGSAAAARARKTNVVS